MKFRNPLDGREVEIGDNETTAHQILIQDGWTKLEAPTPQVEAPTTQQPAEVPPAPASADPRPAPAQTPVTKAPAPAQTPSTVKPAEQADAKVKDGK